MIKTKLATIGAALTLLATPAFAGDAKVGDIVVSKAWTRVTPPGAKVAGGFLTVTNNGETADRLIGGTASIAERTEIHQMTIADGIMKMHEIDGGLEIGPGASVTLKPGSYHIMFMGLKKGLVEGTPVKGMLKFEKAGEVEISYDVEPLGAKSAGSMDHSKMNHGTMNHDKMDHGTMDHDKMDHTKMQHGDHK